MGLFDHAARLASAIIPPHDADPAHQYRWRLTVAVLLMAVTIGQAAHILVACGWLAAYGVPGFAYASDVQDVKNAQARIEVRQIEGQLVAYQKSYCAAIENGKPTKFITDNIRSLEKQYEAIARDHWVRPSCAELGE